MVKKKLEAEITKIEETQEALRESIEAAKVLAEKADKLVRQHKQNLKKIQLED